MVTLHPISQAPVLQTFLLGARGLELEFQYETLAPLKSVRTTPLLSETSISARYAH